MPTHECVKLVKFQFLENIFSQLTGKFFYIHLIHRIEYLPAKNFKAITS